MSIHRELNVGMVASSLTRSAGGIFDCMKSLALEIAKEPGCKIQAFGLEDGSPSSGIAEWGSVPTFLAKRSGLKKIGYAPNLSKTIEHASLDLLHLHGLWMYPSIVSSRWSRLTSKPYIISPHGMLDSWALKNSSWKKQLAGFVFEKRNLERAGCLHALNQAEAASIRDYGLKNPICIVPNGVALPCPVGECRPAAWAEQVPMQSKILLYLGRIHPKKGLANLVHAWAASRAGGRMDNKWHLVVAGWDQGGYEVVLRRLVEEHGLGDSIHFVGPQFGSEKAACYSNADAFVLPSFSEGLPIVLLEAWANNLPVLMTKECNLPEGFEAGAAIKIESSRASIEEGLVALGQMTDRELVMMGKYGRRLVEEQFTWVGAARNMMSVYRWLHNRGSRPSCVISG